jgi:hypothetical protein
MLRQMVVAGVLLVAYTSWASADDGKERGAYLVNAVMACDGCHTPRDRNGPLPGRRFSGACQLWDTPAFRCGDRTSRPIRRPALALGPWPT